MKITIVDLYPSRGGEPVTRTYEADDLINSSVSTIIPELRARVFLAEVRKTLLYSRYDASVVPWDEKRLSALESRVGHIDIEARFPHRWSWPKPLTPEVAVQATDRAVLRGSKELTFYVNFFPFSMAHNTRVAIELVEESLVRSTAPVLENMSLKAQQTKTALKKLSLQMPWEASSLGRIAETKTKPPR